MPEASYGHLVTNDQGIYQINPNADDEEWSEVIATADSVELVGPLTGWEPYTQVWKVMVQGTELCYFTRP